MLAIIDNVSRLGICERVCAPSEMIAAFEQQHIVAALAKPDSRGKPGEPASDYHDALGHYLLNLLFNQMLRATFNLRDFETERRLR